MLYLRIHQEDQLCFFDLSWGQGQWLSRTLNFPTALMMLYRDWQHTDLSFYQNSDLDPPPAPEALALPSSNLE